MACNKLQIEKQLARILRSLTFKGGAPGFKPNPKLAELLAFIVSKNLAGKPPSEVELLTEHFRVPNLETALENGSARVAVRRLREKLTEYHAEFGAHDTITLQIETIGYKLDCSANPTSLAVKETILGFDRVDQEEPVEIEQAIAHFNNAIALDADYAEARAGRASALLTKTLHSYDVDPAGIFLEAERDAERSIELDERCWLGLASRGAIYTFRHRWQAAKQDFMSAAEIAPVELSETGGYGPHLLATGQYEEAMNLAMQYREEGFNKYVLLVRAALYLYVLRRHEAALDVLQRAYLQNRKFWRTHLGFAFVYLALGDAEKAAAHMADIQALTGTQLWPGFNVICLAEAGRQEQAQTQYEAVIAESQKAYLQPVQVALAHVGMDVPESAIQQLSLGCEQADPFTAWLHLWPMLDPIERKPGFMQLLKRRGLPSRYR